jgi:hypothetical protein
MAKVVKHQAKDGSLHNTAKECEAHDRKLRIAPAMEKFVNSLGAGSKGVSIDHEGEHGFFLIKLTDLPTFLSEHAEQIRDAITGALVVRRPRKAAKPKVAPTPAAAA